MARCVIPPGALGTPPTGPDPTNSRYKSRGKVVDSQWLAGLRERLDRLFAAHGAAGQGSAAAGLREATREAEAVLARLRGSLGETETMLDSERRLLEDVERRGRLAAAVPDAETVAIAARFATRHRERVVLLERKVAVQRDELQLAERELEELATHAAQLGRRDVADELRSAAKTGEHPAAGRQPSFEEELKRMQTERRLMDEAVERQLAYLKRKLGKDSI